MNLATQALVIKAREHYEKWLLKKTKQLKDAGQFYEAMQIVAVYAQAEMAELVAQGYQEHAVEEVMLQLYILSAPELLDDLRERWSGRMELAYQGTCSVATGCRPVHRR
jgi:hypothetical protein